MLLTHRPSRPSREAPVADSIVHHVLAQRETRIPKTRLISALVSFGIRFQAPGSIWLVLAFVRQVNEVAFAGRLVPLPDVVQRLDHAPSRGPDTQWMKILRLQRKSGSTPTPRHQMHVYKVRFGPIALFILQRGAPILGVLRQGGWWSAVNF